ncbi:MAG TPA: hypothetical protein VFB25_04165 [Gaiellaceae bacterium]|nr:hypothetical protein [Gaiellaceae bacterium]
MAGARHARLAVPLVLPAVVAALELIGLDHGWTAAVPTVLIAALLAPFALLTHRRPHLLLLALCIAIVAVFVGLVVNLAIYPLE